MNMILEKPVCNSLKYISNGTMIRMWWWQWESWLGVGWFGSLRSPLCAETHIAQNYLFAPLYFPTPLQLSEATWLALANDM